MLKENFEALVRGEDIRKNLIEMKEQIKDEDKKEELLNLSKDSSIFVELLKEEDPKVRKNTALILGILKMQDALEALFRAYENEKTLFVRSAYLTAMQGLDCTDYRERLEQRYQTLLDMDVAEEEKKHIRKERQELEAVLRKKESRFHPFCGYETESEVILTTDRGFAKLTEEQIYGAKTAVSLSGVRVKTKNLSSILKIRTFREMLFPVSVKEPFLPVAKEAADSILKGGLMELLKQHLEGEAPYYFRIQVMAPMENEKKTDFIKKTAYALEEASGYRLLNAKDRYEIELRLIQNKEGLFRAYLKFYTLPMHRFAYRKNVLPVSIHPTQAALLLRLAKPYLKDDAAVLDPFCGVGTMLLEREQILPARTLYGIDVYGDAIKGARENTKLAKAEVSYIQKDFFDFTHRHKFDEILTNMPGRGKKSKEEQDAFYGRFFEKAGEHLTKDGVIIMYSNENGFVKKQLRLHKDLELLGEYCIRQKEGYYLFIIGIKE